MINNTKNKFIITTVIVVVIIIVVLFYIYKKPASPPEQLTDHAIKSLEYKVEQLEETIKKIDRNIQKEVEGIHEKANQEVSSMSNDSVADELNRELDMWRSNSEMDSRP